MYSKNIHSGAANVVHNWANELTVKYKKDDTAGSLFFKGRTIYSYGYHFPIATIHTNKKGVKVVLFTTRGYSNTTAKHIRQVSMGCSQYAQILCANPEQAASNDHERNLTEFERAAKSQLSYLEKAKKPEIYLNAIAYQKELATKYAEYFGIENSKAFKSLAYIHIASKDGGKVATEKERKAVEKEKKAREKRQKIEFENRLKKEVKDVEKFKAFELDRVYTVSEFSYLRFNKETNRIETSQRVEIPIKIAERAFKWVMNTIKAGGCNGECSYKILDFEVKEVTGEHVRVGCHLMRIEEINQLAKELNWI